MSLVSSTAKITSGGFYDFPVEQSLRFDGSSYLSRTPSSAGNRKTWTWSGWVKRSTLASSSIQTLFSNDLQNSSDWFSFWFRNDSVGYDISWVTNTNRIILSSTSVYRDVSAWLHIQISVDTTNSTAANRVRIYINGLEVTLDNYEVGSGYVAQNANLSINLTNSHAIGRRNGATPDGYFNGYIANIQFIDGQALDASYFGETKSGVWVPKAYTGSYGTNGFHLTFEDATSTTTLGYDYSGNNNHWTLN